MSERTLKLREELYGEVMDFMRVTFPGMIDRAYEFFWEEEDPEEFLSELALELGFINFEDWFVCDYREPEGGVIDLYLAKSGAQDPARFEPLKNSEISAFVVRKVSEDNMEIEDLLLAKSYTVSPVPFEGIKEGDFFASRVLEIEDETVLGACVYPFGEGMRNAVLSAINSQFIRYKKNKNPQGTMREFLKEEAYSFNMIWMSGLYKKKSE
jgi:hypothetical protein